MVKNYFWPNSTFLTSVKIKFMNCKNLLQLCPWKDSCQLKPGRNLSYFLFQHNWSFERESSWNSLDGIYNYKVKIVEKYCLSMVLINASQIFNKWSNGLNVCRIYGCLNLKMHFISNTKFLLILPKKITSAW